MKISRIVTVMVLGLSLMLGLVACGGGGFDTSRNITVLAREDGSGTKSAFMDIIGLKDKPDPAGVIIQPSTAAINAEVRNNTTAIAYESLGFVADDVKKLSVDGVEPTVDNINSGSYQIARPLAVVYHESSLSDEVVKAFFDFMQSSEAQAIINEEGFVPVLSSASAYTVNGALSGTIDVSGSTSVQPLMIELAAAFEHLQPNVSVNVSGGGSGTGYNNAEEGVSDFGMVSEVFNSERAPSCTFTNIARDGIAVIVHKDNPLTSITMEQLRGIFDGEAGAAAITTWSSLITN
ncbi:MAG: substrate-binding domain-containing protein [Oscillospiraceae bacterium]|nr:substrate-binding domain-containing protein [Oscillospiraceae bacterium]